MKRIISHIVLVAMVALAVSSCTRNKGDIGYYFGTWRLDNISVAVDDEQSGHSYSIESVDSVFWGFQSGIVFMQRQNPYHTYTRYWGNWSETDGTMTLSFTNTDNNFTTPGAGHYGFLPGIYLPKNGVVELDVKLLDKHSMILTRRVDVESAIYTYYFTKW